MFPSTAERGLSSATASKQPRLESSIGQLSKLSLENRLLKSTSSNSRTSGLGNPLDNLSLTSQRRQNLLSNLTTIFPEKSQKKAGQKLKLDLSNPLLKSKSSLLSSYGSDGLKKQPLQPQAGLSSKNSKMLFKPTSSSNLSGAHLLRRYFFCENSQAFKIDTDQVNN